MSRRRISWSNHQTSSYFTLSGSDLRVYKYGGKEDFKLVTVYSDIAYVKCCAWGVKSFEDYMAIGYSNGRVILSALSEESPNLKGLQVRAEFLPKHSRPCVTVGFCPSYPELLFSGLEKVRNDYCLLVWDVNIASSVADQNVSEDVPNDSISRGSSPIVQLGSSESVSSATWFYDTSPRLVAGMGAKWIRSYDLRSPTNSAPVFSVPTKAVNGIVTDPFFQSRFASFGDESIIRIWDERKVAEPVLSFPVEGKSGLSQLGWSPDHEGVLCSIGRESETVNFWFINNIRSDETKSDMQSPERVNYDHQSPEAISLPVVSKTRQASFNQLIQDFAWIPIASSPAPGVPYIVGLGKDFTLRVSSLPSFCCVDVSANNSIVIAPTIPTDQKWKFKKQDREDGHLDDISQVMHDRAVQGYGAETETNIQIIRDNADLESAWNFISNAQALLMADSSLSDIALDGIYGLIEEDRKYEEFDIPSSNENKIIFYGGPRRRAAFALCGWVAIDEEALYLTTFAKHLESLGKYERAAYVTYFESGSWSDVLECLQRSEDERLQIVAAALAGSIENVGTKGLDAVWKSILDKLRTDVKSPYLRALFALNQDQNTIEYLNYSDLPLVDKVGTALRTLGNDELLEFLDTQWSDTLNDGDIAGLLLHGLSERGIGLVQAYLNRTGDVQSASLLTVLAQRNTKNETVSQWIEIYRDFLDQLELFSIRARFDIARQRLSTSQDIPKPPQIFVRCQFCGFPLSKAGQSLNAGPPTLASMTGPTTSVKLKAGCPQCRKPLPRCSICLINMGVPLSQDKINSGTDSWFIWCQRCHHGGHSKHLQDWFEKHPTCPVSNCMCLCSSL